MLKFIQAIPSGFLWGFLGAAAANSLRLFTFVGRKDGQRAAILGDRLYWLEFAVLPIIGGVVAAAYGERCPDFPRLLSFHLGLSAPAIIRLGFGSVSHGNEPTDPATKAGR